MKSKIAFGRKILKIFAISLIGAVDSGEKSKATFTGELVTHTI